MFMVAPYPHANINYSPNYNKMTRHLHNKANGETHNKKKGGHQDISKIPKDSCYRCGSKGR